MLLIDNQSSAAVRDRYDLSWHPHGRHLLATTLGKTHAIAEGVDKATGDTVVIVDDDNVLQEDYLQVAEQIFREYPLVGAAGGSIEGEFETPPPPWATPYLPYLAIGNLGEQIQYAFTPDPVLVRPGAGMVIRKAVVERYLRIISNDPVRQSLDPVGARLSRAGDTDMMLCAYEVGLAKGYFPALRLTHLISSNRLTLDYLCRLREEGEYCNALLMLIRGFSWAPHRLQFLLNCREIVRESLRARVLLWQRFWVEWAILRGERRATREFSVLNRT